MSKGEYPRKWCRIKEAADQLVFGRTQENELVVIRRDRLNVEPQIGDVVSFEAEPAKPRPDLLHPAKYFARYPVIFARVIAEDKSALTRREEF